MRLFLLIAALLAFVARAPGADSYSANPGPYGVATLDATWHDAKRDRDVPVRICYPKPLGLAAKPTCPVIIFSHGLGGSREGYAYLGEHWASCGYVSVHVQHHGSDREILHSLRPLKALRAAATDPAVATNRPLDISFAIDRLTVLNGDRSFPLHGRLDLARLGVAGHSYGAFTTMALAGARIPALGPEPRYRDPRIKAAIAMSTPTTQGNDTDAAFDGVSIPVFHMTGTKDELPGERRSTDTAPIVGNTKAAERLRPYQHTCHAPADLLVLKDGDHMVFSGRLTGSRPADKAFQDRVLASSTAFWDAWLRDDPSARRWLEDGAFAAVLGALGTFEHKPGT